MGRRSKPSRGFIVFLTSVLAVPTVSYLLYRQPDWTDMAAMKPLLLVGAALGAAQVLLRPVLRLITAPLGCLTFGLSGTAIDVGLIYLSARFVNSFHVPSLWFALLTAGLINVVSAIFGGRK